MHSRIFNGCCDSDPNPDPVLGQGKNYYLLFKRAQKNSYLISLIHIY